jgi:hypothetical protein
MNNSRKVQDECYLEKNAVRQGVVANAASLMISTDFLQRRFLKDLNSTCKVTEDPWYILVIESKKVSEIVPSSEEYSLLSIGASVAVERVFNTGRDVISLRRNSLGPETSRNIIHGRHILKKGNNSFFVLV